MAGASPDAPYKYMSQKLYTIGQIGKKHKTSLSSVYEWLYKLGERYKGSGGKNGGVIPIPNDPYGRSGVPEDIVDLFPNLPDIKQDQLMKPLIIENKLTPENAKKSGYEWVKDVIYDGVTPLGNMGELILLVKDEGYKLGSPANKKTFEYLRGLYRPFNS